MFEAELDNCSCRSLVGLSGLFSGTIIEFELQEAFRLVFDFDESANIKLTFKESSRVIAVAQKRKTGVQGLKVLQLEVVGETQTSTSPC